MKSIINNIKAYAENKGLMKTTLVFAVLTVAFSTALYSPILKTNVKQAHAQFDDGSDDDGGMTDAGSDSGWLDPSGSSDTYQGGSDSGWQDSSCDSSCYSSPSDSYTGGDTGWYDSSCDSSCGGSTDYSGNGYNSYDCGCENYSGSSYYPTQNYSTPVVTTPTKTTVINNNNTNNNKNVNNNNITINTPVTTTVQQPVVTPPTVYTPPPTYYYPPTQTTVPLTVSCSANQTNPYVGSSVIWTAYASGGNTSNGYNYGNQYSYSWTGSNGLYGNGNSISENYNIPGVQTATVTVYSNGQTASQTCSVNVQGQQYIAPIVYTQPSSVQVTQVPTTGTPSAGVFLSQIPATGISSNLKTTLFLLGITLWSAFMAYMIIAKKKLKLATSASAGAVASGNDGEVSLSEQVRKFKEQNKILKEII